MRRRVSGNRRWTLPVLSAAAFMASLDLLIVNVAFAATGRDFAGTQLSELSWVLNAYAILYAALLVPFGRLADRYGQKTVFLAGLAVFTAGSDHDGLETQSRCGSRCCHGSG